MSAALGFVDTAGHLVADGPDGATPPAGVALATRAPGLDQSCAAGSRDVSSDGAPGTAMTTGTHHDLASVTKVVATTTALLRLVSDDVVALDDVARRFLPDLGAGEKSTITLRQLLLHRAGLWEWHPLYLAATEPDAAADLARRLPLRYRPDAGRHYSDLGFVLLGQVIAAVTGQPLGDAIATLVTGPLGLVSTRFAHPTGTDVAASAWGDQIERDMVDTGRPYPVPYRSADFTAWRREPVRGDVCDGNAFHCFGGVSGHAGLFSTLADLITYADAFANYADHDDLWRPDAAEEFFAAGPDAGQALGFRRYTVGIGPERLDVLGHPGFTGCAVGFVPGRGISVALASNRLLTAGVPVPTDHLWSTALAAAGRAIEEQSP